MSAIVVPTQVCRRRRRRGVGRVQVPREMEWLDDIVCRREIPSRLLLETSKKDHEPSSARLGRRTYLVFIRVKPHFTSLRRRLLQRRTLPCFIRRILPLKSFPNTKPVHESYPPLTRPL